MLIKIKKLSPQGKIPTKRVEDAGYDLYAADRVSILPGQRMLIKTDIALEIPDGYYGHICPRSGLALKHGIQVMAGIIDPSYRNNIGVVLYNSCIVGTNINQLNSLTKDPNTFEINIGDRIAQIIFKQYHEFEFEEGELSESSRGMGGFGSTGK